MNPVAGVRSRWPVLPDDLARLRRVATVLFALQLVLVLVWSAVLWSHFSLTDDDGVYWQAWWKLSHGHLNPYDSFGDYPFWKDHGVLLMWPLALITHFGLGGYTPLAIQDIALVASEVIAFSWILRLLRDHEADLRLPRWSFAAISLVLLIANPWTYWALSFDLHLDVVLAAPFIVLTLRALYYRQYRWLALWATFTLLCGDIAETLVAAVGVSGLLVSLRPNQRRVVASAALLAAGVVTFVALIHLQGGRGGVAGFAPAVHGQVPGPGTAGHAAGGSGGAALTPPVSPPRASTTSTVLTALSPGHLVSHLWQERTNLWALISPAGLLGVFSVWGLPLTLAIAVENSSVGRAFTFDGFQYAALWGPFVVAGVMAAIGIARRRRRVAAVILLVSALNTITWAAVWVPRVPHQWLRVDDGTARMLDRADALIPSDAEVIASQGIVGRFADRDWIYSYPANGPSHLQKVQVPELYFVVVPYEGIELVQIDQALNLLGLLAGPLHAELVLHGQGVWVFRWHAPPGVDVVNLYRVYSHSNLPVWAAKTAVGTPQLAGPPHDWDMTTTSTTSHAGGYLLYGAYYTRPLGHYELEVRLATSGTANVEAWNTYGDVLLGRRIVPQTDGIVTVDVPVPSTYAYRPPLFRGGFGFRTQPVEPPAGQVIEARVYVPPSTTGTVYSVRLVRVGQ